MTRTTSVARALTVVALTFGVLSCSSSDGQESTRVEETEVNLGPGSGSEQAAGDYRPLGAEKNNAWVRKMVDCLNDGGFKAEAFESSPGIMGFQQAGQAQQQASAWSNGIDSCQTKVGKPPELPRFTDSQLSNLYDFYLRQKDCLVGEGYTISDPPSRDTFVNTYYSSDPWGPYADIGRVSPTTMADLESKCPQQPTAEDVN